MKLELSQKSRLVALLLYISAVVVAGKLVTGTWIPSGGLESEWFFGVIGYIFFTHISAPFFVPPRDSLVTSATAALLLGTIDLSSVPQFGYQLEIFRWVSFGIALLASISSMVAILLYSSKRVENHVLTIISRISYWVSTRLGRGQIILSPVVLISIAGAFQDQPTQQISLLLIWSIIVFMEPIEVFLAAVNEFRKLGAEDMLEAVGEIDRIDDPNIIRVKLDNPQAWKRENIHTACLHDSRQVEIIPLFYQVQEEGIIGTGICHRECGKITPRATAGLVYKDKESRRLELVLSEMCGGEVAADLIGFIVENSQISKIRFEVASEVDLEEGALVLVHQKGIPVYYQILGAHTDEEIFSRNPRGTHVAIATQLGSINVHGGFDLYRWVPSMNTPVFLPKDIPLEDRDGADPDELILGYVPNSNIPVLASFNEMLEYHSAILGVTGMGKTELAFEIVRFAYKQGVKVICVDFTGEYVPRLSDLDPEALGLETEQAEELQSRLFDVEEGSYSAADEKKALRKFVEEIRPAINDQVTEFLSSEGPGLGVYDLDEIANTKATLRATELYLSSIFNWARKNRRKQKILLVLEEAHTVIPEFNLYARDRVETGAVVGRMAQIALQGRKYGVGNLLISQRTALVSKTLLSQCNTVITFALHDQTGLNYLGDVFSSEHVSAIPNLEFLHAMAFGKSIKSPRPIIFRIPEIEAKRIASQELDQSEPER